MAAQKDKGDKGENTKGKASRSKPPETAPDDVDGGWFDDDEEPTTLKAPKKAAEAPKPSPKSSKPVAATKGASKAPGPGAMRAAAKLMPPRRHTVEVQLDWLEPDPPPGPEKEKTIPVQTEWLELMDVNDEPPTVVRGRRGPPPIPGPPPLPRDVVEDQDTKSSKPASKASSKPTSKSGAKPPARIPTRLPTKPSGKSTPPRRKP
jgi:hypothetical protein